MRSTFVAVAMVVVAVTPTFAARKHHQPTPTFASERQPTTAALGQNQPKPSYDTCATLSVQRGVAPGQGSNNPENHHTAFMQQCQDGKIPVGQ